MAKSPRTTVGATTSNGGGGGASASSARRRRNKENDSGNATATAPSSDGKGPPSTSTPPAPPSPNDGGSGAITGANTMTAESRSRVRSAAVWDVKIPPAVNSAGGRFLPRILTHSNRDRRISVEVRTTATPPRPPVARDRDHRHGPNDGSEPLLAASVTATGTGAAGGGGTGTARMGTGAGAGMDEYACVRVFVPATSREARAVRDAASRVGRGAGRAARGVGGAAGGAADRVRRTGAAGGVGDGAGDVNGDANANGSGSGVAGIIGGIDDVDMADSEDMSVSTLGVRGVDDSTAVVAAAEYARRGRDANGGGGGGSEELVPTKAGSPSTMPSSSSPPSPATPSSASQLQHRHQQQQLPNHQNAWVEKYNLPLKNVTISKRVRNVVVVTMVHEDRSGSKKKRTREIIFKDDREAISFDRLVKNEKKAEADRSKKFMKAALGGKKIIPSESVRILVEIVSAWDLHAGDFLTSDPYVVVRMGDEEVHRTRHISKTLNPIWTVKTGALFVLSSTSKQLFRHYEGIKFEVRDYDALGDDEGLGYVMVPPKTLYEGNGDRLEFDLESPPGSKLPAKGTLVLRCRHASTEDLQFMLDLARQQPQSDPLSLVRPKVRANLANMLVRNTKIENGATKVRVRPEPDPKRKAETEWMTEALVESTTYEKSRQWLEAGSGKLGRIYLEILGCDGLPNMDSGGGVGTLVGNKTDAFVAAVFEDCIVQTDIVDDCLSPRWLPWTRRAFIFHIMHPSSQLFLGVFDFDPGNVNDHDPIGRVSVNLSNLQPGTECVLFYNLYSSSTTTNRKPKGTITIRVRLEWEDERQVLLSVLEQLPPPEVYVNCRREKDYQLVKYACEGKYRKYAYSTKTLTTYVEELQTYQLVLFYVQEAVINLIFWRSSVDFEIPVPCFPPKKDENGEDRFTRPVTLSIPVHSLTAFVMGTMLVERPRLFPSFSAGCLGWLMLATMGFRLSNPSPWRRVKSFKDLFWTLTFGYPLSDPHAIDKYENEEEFIRFAKRWEEKVALAEKLAAKRAEENAKALEEYNREMAEVGVEDVDEGGFTVDPLKGVLFPIQKHLGFVCEILRVVRNVVIWDECYFSFWITIGSFALMFVFLFVPWAFVIRWTSRAIAWLCLGPHMKLVDLYYYSKLKTDEETQLENLRKSAQQVTENAVKQARIEKERRKKLKDMKVYKFGEHITYIPVLKLDRQRDVPLSQSYATLYQAEQLTMVELAMEEAGKDRIKVPGQQLIGDMIPKPEPAPVTTAPVGQPTGRPWLRENGTIAALGLGGNSNISAVVKVGAVVTGAALLTWFGVPLMTSAVHFVTDSVVVGPMHWYKA